MGNNNTKFFLSSPEYYTHFYIHKGESRDFLICFVLPFEEKLLSVSLAISLGKTQRVSLFCTSHG